MKNIENRLNLKYYKGSDIYSDGSIEDELLDIVKSNDSSEYEEIIYNRKSWPVFYHLSNTRETIINWLDISSYAEVLEIGSGCGAITGALAKKSKTVTCIDLSKKRSLINLYKNKHENNIEILVGNFEDIEPNLDCKYDIITLIGVFEYSGLYINHKKPFHEMLNRAKRHLKPNGQIIIAIENRFGLKYWAGCKEDHVSKFFEGIEGYPTTNGVRTFTKNELENIFRETQINDFKFYYPYPDYKFATDIYTDEYLPKIDELSNNHRNFDQDRIILFDETKVFNSLIENNMFPMFSNSFLIVIKGD